MFIKKMLCLNLENFRLGFNLKNKELYRKKLRPMYRPRNLEGFKLFDAAPSFLRKQKLRLKLKKYLFSKTSIEKRTLRFKGDKLLKFPLSFNNLTFAQPKFISIVKNTLNNPVYGGVRKGTYKGFFQILGLKEKVNMFIKPRVFYLARLQIFKKYWEKKELKRLILLACIQKTLNFVNKIINYKDFIVNSQFYYRKRWFLFDFYNLK